MRRGVVIGLGNKYRGDDAAGPALVERVRAANPGAVSYHDVAGDALALVDLWDGADWAVVLDVAVSGAPAGRLHRMEAASGVLPKDLGRCSTHGFGLSEVVALARTLGRLPGRLVVYAVEGACFDSGAGLSQQVQAALDPAARRVCQEIGELSREREAAPCTKPD